jgi:hypothetical protein
MDIPAIWATSKSEEVYVIQDSFVAQQTERGLLRDKHSCLSKSGNQERFVSKKKAVPMLVGGKWDTNRCDQKNVVHIQVYTVLGVALGTTSLALAS